jgi:hypothetical protein
MSNVMILDYNYASDSDSTNFTYSSQQSAFPASNTQDLQRRHKVWRTNGYWEITSSNNVIVFRESTGVDLTATIAVASYASTSSFLTAIKTALESTGASTYTVSQDATTKKIKIVSDGSGGDNLFQLMWTDVLSTAAVTLGFDTAVDDTGTLTYMAAVLKIHTSEWLKYDLGASTIVDAMAFIGIRNEVLKLSPSATLKIQANHTDAWSSPALDTALEYHDNTIALVDADGLSATAYRYWRLYVEDQSNSYGYVEMSTVYLGSAWTPAQGAIKFPLEKKWLDNSVMTKVESGHLVSMKKEKTREYRAQWNFLSKADVHDLDIIFENHGKHIPFFISLDPNEVFSESFQDALVYVRLGDEPEDTLESPGNFSMSMKLVEVI